MINSLLDTDFYKFTMQAAVQECYPEARVEYSLFPRSTPLPWNDRYLGLVREQVESLRGLSISREELAWLKGLEILPEGYVDNLEHARLNPDQVAFEKTKDGQLGVKIEGLWSETILWEVPLLAILTQAYYEIIDTDWDLNLKEYEKKSRKKAERLSKAGCPFSDFGTRRRRNRAVQETAVRAFAEVAGSFAGTSNVGMARRYGVTPIGTVAHEWIMGIAGIYGAAESNAIACREWIRVHKRLNLIALTDTYTVDMFLRNFTSSLAEAYDGVRHDSGDPFAFANQMEDFYNGKEIEPSEKTLVFSDSLNVDKAIEIQKYVGDRMKTAYGIGTHFTNDFPGKTLDIVIKLTSIDGKSVAKLTNDPSKATGSDSSIHNAKRDVEQTLGKDL